jgi:hypothetical protein
MNNKLEKEDVMVQFDLLSQHLHGRTKENHKILRTVVLQARF